VKRRVGTPNTNKQVNSQQYSLEIIEQQPRHLWFSIVIAADDNPVRGYNIVFPSMSRTWFRARKLTKSLGRSFLDEKII
jgi:hypothetical protein